MNYCHIDLNFSKKLLKKNRIMFIIYKIINARRKDVKMKKKYKTPEMEITEFDTKDVITTSGGSECDDTLYEKEE